MSTQIIAVTVQKGGTGKTTTAAALAQAAAYKGYRVLAIDLDPQGNLSFALGANPRGHGALDLLEGKSPANIIQRRQGLDVIPAAYNLAAATTYRGSARRLEKALERVRGRYDYIFIDTPTQAGELQYNALQAATGIVIPLEAGIYNLQSLYQTVDMARKMQQSNPALEIKGFIFTRYSTRANHSRQMIETMKAKAAQEGAPFLGITHKGVAIEEAAAYQVSLYEHAPRSQPAKDYLAILEKLEAQVT